MAAILLLPWILEKEIAVEEDDPGRFLPLSLQDKSKDLRLKPVLDSKKLGQIKEDRVPFFLKAVGIVLQRKIFLAPAFVSGYGLDADKSDRCSPHHRKNGDPPPDFCSLQNSCSSRS